MHTHEKYRQLFDRMDQIGELVESLYETIGELMDQSLMDRAQNLCDTASVREQDYRALREELMLQ